MPPNQHHHHNQQQQPLRRRRRLGLVLTSLFIYSSSISSPQVAAQHGGADPLHQPHRPFDAEIAADGEFQQQRQLAINDLLGGEFGSRLLEPFLVYNESSTTANNYDPWFPGCPVFDNINKDANLGCNFIRINKDVLTAFWVDFRKTASTTRPLNPDGTLPHALADHRPNPPRQVDRATVYKERPTYYYCYRLILLMYAIAFEYETSKMTSELPKLVPDWEHERYYMVDYLKPRNAWKAGLRRKSPIAISMMQGERMLIVIRGTIWTEEWCKDFMYKWSRDEDAKLFPGHTHEGMYSVFIDFYQELEAEIEQRKPRYIMVTGHSLGAGLANMIGLRLETRLLHKADRIDVIGYGGPNTGDAVFAEQFRTKVNSRHLIFLGRGNHPNADMYTVGDITAQYTCEAYPGCGILDTGPFGNWYKYVRPHNQVPFYAEEMPNPKKWNQVSNIRRLIPSTRAVLASHVCSYICWTSQAMGDLDSRCYFEDEEGRPDLPKTYYCDVSEILL